jgi:putative ABC transport system ATP-binding protein
MDETVINIENVVKTYPIGIEVFKALRGVSLEVKKGAFMSIVGPSGSGKTTLLNLIGGLDTPTEGSIFFYDKNLSQMTRKEMAAYRRDNIGFIFQSYNLLPVYTVYENVLFPLLVMGKREGDVRKSVEDMVARVGLAECTNKRPNQLSGGQCQRVAIARALVKHPPIALADEPTANLDAENSRQILELMMELNCELKTIFILSTHDERVSKFVTREVKLEDGMISQDIIMNGSK